MLKFNRLRKLFNMYKKRLNKVLELKRVKIIVSKESGWSCGKNNSIGSEKF